MARARLTKKQRAIAAQRRLEGASLRAIGEELGVSHPTVMTALKQHAKELERDRLTREAKAREARRAKPDPQRRPEQTRDLRGSSQASPPPTSGVTVNRRSEGGQNVNTALTFAGEGKMRVGFGGNRGQSYTYEDWLNERDQRRGR